MSKPSFDTNRKFVRVLATDRLGMVEFEFAIGDPETFVELIMPPAAFEEFCAAHAVEFVGPRRAGRAAHEWTLREATHRHSGQ